MVVPLAKQGHHVRIHGVIAYACVSCAQDVVGHLSHLRVKKVRMHNSGIKTSKYIH